MSALVSYESSDDEEAPSATNAQRGEQVNGQKQPKEEDLNVSTDISDSKPMIGPSRLDAVSTQEIKDADPDELQVPQGLSEQDLIRFLTQATHPMTALPPSPAGSPNPQTEAKFKRFLELKSKGLHFNEDLANKATFTNPALLSTLMDRAGIHGNAQYATSLQKSVWDPRSLPAFAYKEKLLRTQNEIRDQEAVRMKQASTAGKRKIDFTSSGHSGTSSRTSTPG